MENSHIEWTDHTWNPWIGCTKVDKLCINCYAEARDIRFEDGKHWGKGAPRQRTSASNWKQPLKWNRDAKEAYLTHNATPRPRVFCASLADWLDDEVPVEWLAEMLKTVMECKNLTWLLLTKRPQNWAPRVECVLKYIEALPDWDADPLHPLLPLRNWLADWFVLRKAPENVWMGTSVGDQESADTRIPLLLAIPAKIRFLSCEPLLGVVDLQRACGGAAISGRIDWLITGGESGQRARPMHPEWPRYLRAQCAEAKIAFFFKQWGEWAPASESEKTISVQLAQPSDIKNPSWHEFSETEFVPRQLMARVGKRASGNLIDGKEWKEFPK